MPLPIILEACDRAIAKDKVEDVFKYCDSIINNWHKDGVVSLEDIHRVSAEYAKNVRKAVSASPATRKPTRFANFKQREWDFNEVERVERAYQEMRKGIKGSTNGRIGI